MKPAIVLALIATIVPELLTGSTPLPRLLNGGMFLWLFCGYGLAVLVVREYAVRHNLGFSGIFKVGMAYAIFNEGLLAKTMIINSGHPIPQFNEYGYFFGFSWPNIFLITPWHALASVMTPILLTYLLFPKERDVPWLGKKTALLMGMVLLALACTFFLGPVRIPGSYTQLAVFLFVMGFLFWHAKRFPGLAQIADPVSPLGIKPVLYGASIFFPSVMLFSIAGGRVSPIIFLILAFLAVWIYKRAIRNNAWLTVPALALFGVGSYMQTAFTGMLITLIAQLPSTDFIIPVGIGAEIILVLVVRKIIRISREDLFMGQAFPTA